MTIPLTDPIGTFCGVNWSVGELVCFAVEATSNYRVDFWAARQRRPIESFRFLRLGCNLAEGGRVCLIEGGRDARRLAYERMSRD